MLTRKTFTTKDSRGCEFICEGYVSRNYSGGPVVESKYCGQGETAETLKELKIKIGNK